MPVLHLDFETHHTKDVSLEKMTIRQYLAKAPIIGVGFAVDEDAPIWIDAQKDPHAFMEWCCDIEPFLTDPDWVVSGHNAAGFDCRVLRFGRLEPDGEPLDLPWPARIHDTLELAMAAWPNQPGGYGLGNLATWLHLPPKLSLRDAESGRVGWAEYCTRDVEIARAIHRLALGRIPADELLVAELACRVRGLHFEIDADQVSKSLHDFTAVTADAVAKVVAHYGRDGAELFGGVLDTGVARSVKPLTLKKMLLERLGFDTPTTSLKKINPTKLAQAPDVGALLQQTTKANKGLFYQRRAKALIGVSHVDIELGYFRATNTGRYSAPTTGRGINTHNLAKHDKAVAKPLRQMLSLPEGQCFVRADAANVEYRIEGLLTGCAYVREMFEADIGADPYGAFGFRAFNILCAKVGPTAALRQLAKAAVLGLGFYMGLRRWLDELGKTIAKPENGVTLADLDRMCRDKGWGPPNTRGLKAAQTMTGAAWQVARVGYETREAFHAVHSEFFRVADWLDLAVTKLAASSDPDRLLESLYALDAAPDRRKVELFVDRDLEFPTVRVRLMGHPMPTVTWRALSVAYPGVDGLGAMTANKGPRKVYRSIFIENITQSAARNALVRAKLELNKRGWTHIHSIHDEILIVCPREPKAVLKARADLAEVMSPKGPLGLGWAFYAKPSDITISRSLWEDEKDSAARWPRIELNEPNCLENLP